jgi:amino acid adenylation domain-containing protein
MDGDELVARAAGGRLDPELVALLRENKPGLLELLRSDRYAAVLAERAPLVELSDAERDGIAAGVDGGADNVQDVYPLTPLQEGMLFHHLLDQEGDPYLMANLRRFDSRERLDAYLSAFDAVIARHDILRTAVVWEGVREPVQVVWRRARLRVEEVEPDAAGGDVARALWDRLDPRRTRLDVRRAPMMRAGVARDAEGRWLLLVQEHHLAADHVTTEVMQAEIRAHLEGREAELPPALPFRTHVAQARSPARRAEDEAYFRALLGDVGEPTAPFGLAGARGDGTGIEQRRRALDPALAARVRERARVLRVSVASICHLAWALVAARTSGTRDVVFGTVLFGRLGGGAGAGRVLGPLINTLPVRIRVDDEGVEASLRAAHAQLGRLLLREHASLALAQRCSGVQAPAPLFTSLLNYRRGPGAGAAHAASLAGAAEGRRLGGQERTNYPLTLMVDDVGEALALTAHAPASVGAERVCALMERALEALAEALEAAPDRPVGTLDVLPEAERRRVVEEWNRTEAADPGGSCVHALFEAQVERTPDAVAVVFEGERLSYAELNARANRLAHGLRELGVGPDARVAICVERGVEMVVALLAVLKAGGGYVPLDPEYPRDRLRHALEDSAPAALLTQDSLSGLFAGTPVPVVSLDGGTASRAGLPATNPDAAGLAPRHLAYVIYTSGSTGRPKGVMVEHRSVARLFAATDAWFGFGADDVWTLFHSFAFDFSVWEIWGALLYGGRLVVVPRETARSPEDFYALLCREGVTVLSQTPSAFRQLVAAQAAGGAEHRLRCVVFGGEALEPATLGPWFERNDDRRTRLVNMYGITETTVHVTYRPLAAADAERAGPSPIGVRIPDLATYVLDARGRPAPVGVAGELYVGGAGVARGYLNRPELTAGRFVPDPFSAEPGARLYRTGDLARWLPDGTLEYLGRNDHQVKVRGFRIEPGEIEARLLEHPGVREAVVLAREDAPGDRRLVAYLVGEAPEADALRAHLAGRLPEHMVPAAYVRLERFPLTPNGKLDRAALPAPEGDAYARRGYEAPEGETERALAEIWSEVLGVERVGRRDDFFELGGHSLLVVRVVSRVRRVLGAEVELGVVFERPVLRELAEALAAAGRAELPPIERVDRGARLPLSYAQQRLWFLEQMGELGGTYHVPQRLRLRGALDRAALVRALDRLVARHEALRTTFAVVDGEPEQRIGPDTSRFHLVEHDLCGRPGARSELLRIAREEADARFDLERGPLIRGRLVRLAEDDHVLLLTMHHVVSDAWSMRVLVDELGRLYGAFRAGRPDPLPALPVQYADYAAWQRRWVEGEVLERQAGYWTRTLAGAPGMIELPADRPRPQRQDHAGASLRVELDAGLTAALNALGRRHGTTLFMTLLAGWAATLSRLSGQEDVVVGTPSANRGRGEIEGLVGFFVNTLALRVDLSGSPTVAELLARVKRRALEAQQNQDIPFEQVVELVQPARSLAYSPLFQVMFAWQDRQAGDRTLPGLEPAPAAAAPHVTAKFDLLLSLAERGGRIVGDVEYATALFERSTTERWLGYLRRVLEEMAADDGRSVDRLPILSEAERRQVLREWNATDAEYPRDACVHRLFEAQAARTPGATAVVFGDGRVTYGELNARANRLARLLAERGVGPDVRVGLCVERGPEMVVGLLAVLKAGGAYVPLDPGYPEERLLYMLEDSAPAVLLTQASLRPRFDRVGVPVLALDADAASWADRPAADPERGDPTPDHLMYVMYTSGSTGRPKGVMVGHRSAVNRIAWMQAEHGLGAGDAMLQKTTCAFDVSVWEVFWPLAYGARLVLARPDGHRDPAYLVRTVRDAGVTDVHFVPSMLPLFLEHPDAARCTGLRRVYCSGEALPPSLVRRFRELLPHVVLSNWYGPTEGGEVSYWHWAPGGPTGDVVPIGFPIANTRLYVLDRGGEPAPMGVAGELFIGGVALGRGYRGRPGLTAERFVPDPFGEPGARLYRTGDLCRRMPDGAVEYLGRNDFQVKIRGFRVELGDVESRLVQHPGVREAAVVAREEPPGGRRLVAYYVADAPASAEALRAHLHETLPEYMVPAAFVHLAAWPLTPTGKLDRGALPAPGGDAFAARGYEAPLGEAEQALAEIWSELLGVERVGRRDHFFELGGHSLLAVRVVSRVRQVLGAEVAISGLFEHPVLAELARDIEDAARSERPPIERVDRGGRLPLSFAQQRLWFLERLGDVGGTYHIPTRLRLRGELDRGALRRALDAILARHEALRTTFVEVDGEPAQRIAEESRFHLLEHDLGGRPDAAAELRRLVAGEAGARFDLERGPLIRGRLVRLAADDHVLLVTMHHIVSDGWSLGVLTRELGTLYDAFRRGEADPLPPLPVQYADYAAWQRRWVEGGVLRRQAEYWKAALGGAPALLELPADHPRPARQDYAGGVVGIGLDAELTAGLGALSRRHGATLFMTLLAGWAATLGRLSGQEEVVVGTPSANRGGREIEGLIGFFVNTLALRVDLSGSPTVAELLARVRERALGAQQNQDIPFEQVVELVQPARSLSHTPLFQAMLTWQNAPAGGLELPGLALAPLGSALQSEPEPQAAAKFDLSLALSERGGRIAGAVEYAAALFERSTVERWLGCLRLVLEQMAADDARPVGALRLLDAAERSRVLEEWNRTEAPYPRNACVHQLFEAQVERTPHAPATVFEGERLTYAELNARANRLAHRLMALGVGPEVRVGICVERGPEMVAGLLGVLKAGGAYVPLDPDYPAERLAFMLADSAPAAVLAQDHLRDRVEGAGVPVVVLDAAAPAWAELPATNPRVEALGPGHPAYVIYTSGSTGRPKGVVVEHHGLVNRLEWMRREYAVTADDRVLHKTSFGFDVSVWELFLPLLAGARMVVAPPGAHRDAAALVELIIREGVTLLHFVPSLLDAFLETEGVEACTSIRAVISSGEALPRPLARRFFGRLRCGLHNLYGPTEATIDVTHWACEPESELPFVPIGRPVANTRVYVLDSGLEPVPAGVVGELYLGGVQVARGYLNRRALTAEKFVPDPFGGAPGARLYRTGDLARFMAGGAVEFLGRADHQVKVRGFRVEPGEIEARLAEHPGVREAVVLAREDAPGEKRLVAYYLADEPVAVDALRAHLAARLPGHMVPAAYVWLDRLPLTPSGKTDRRALPAPEGDAYARRGYEAPVGETEEALAEIWSEVLGVERVGRRDDFFELGGHSLLIVKLIERMRRRGLHAEVGTLFTIPVLAELAEVVTGETREVAVPPNAIPPGAEAITPEMLPLVELSQADVDRIVAGVEGGAGNVQDVYPLAPLQEGILFHHLLTREGDPYVLPSLTSFERRERLDAYLAALQAVIDRHDVLRTAIAWEGLPEPVQVVWRRARLRVEEVELDAAAGHAARALWDRFDPRHTRLDVGRAPLMRACVARDAAQGRWLLLLQDHHLVRDHSSVEVLHEEIRAHLLGREAELPAPLPFRNFVAQARLGVSQDEHRAFFTGLLGDVDEPTAPFGVLDVRGDGSGMREARLQVDGRLAARLRARARALGVSAASIAHVAWAQVLGRASGRDDVVFGTLLFGRMHGGEGSDRVMGPFINTLPVRVRLGTAGAAASVRETHALLAKLLHHEHASLAQAQRCSGVEAPAPLFTALLNYRHGGGGPRAAAALAAPAADGMRTLYGEERTNYPLTLTVDDLGEGFRLKGQVTHASLDPVRVCALVHRALEGLVEALETAPGRAVGSIDVLPATERARVLEEWNRTEAAYPAGSCVHELFEAQAERTPGAVAVAFGDRRVTYAELNRSANRLAHGLRALGVGPGARVAVCLERSPEMPAALLAVLKAGAAYVPLDPAHPGQRLRYVLEDSRPAVLLTQEALRARGPLAALLAEPGVPVVALDADAPAWAHLPETNPEVEALTPENLAYVIYTSGSTGRPKGVMNPHRGVVNLLLALGRTVAVGPGDRLLAVTTLGFDIAALEIFLPLLSGARLHLLPDGAGADPALLAREIERGGATLLQATPATWRLLVDSGWSGRAGLRALCGGEALPAGLAARVLERVGALWNVYGPTETTIWSTAEAVTAASLRDAAGYVAIGSPVANTRVYVLDAGGEPVPAGVAGELCIGGAGVARGYLGRPGPTAERFVPDPFGGASGARMYRTGDLARRGADGRLEFLGRTDFQVKVRGFRIEPGEIEARLREHPGVREAVVLAREDAPGEQRLVAYLVGDETAGADALRAHLGETLPEYMVPAAYVRLERFPLTPNGKLDRGALPAPGDDALARRGYEAPAGAVEEALAAIWAEVLGVERVGRRDGFFELGGHSLSAVRLISGVRRRLGVEVALDALFQRPVLADFARGLREDFFDGLVAAASAQGGADVPVPVRATGSERPLFLVHDGLGSIGYAQVLAWQVSPGIPVYALPPLLDDECSLRTIQDMGARFVRMIRSVQPSGPYRVAGHSLGGMLAYEAAAQLVAAGQEVEFLGLIDTSYTSASRRAPDATQPSLAKVFRRLCEREGKEGWSEATLQELTSRPELSDLGALIHAGYEAGLFAEPFTAERVSRLRQQMWFYPLALRDYTPPGIPVPVCYFEAMEGPGAGGSQGWREFLAETSIRVTPVPGTHGSMMGPDHVPVLGRALSREIARASENGGPGPVR